MSTKSRSSSLSSSLSKSTSKSSSKKGRDEYDPEQTKKAEQVYEVLKNKIATSPKVSDDIMESFQRLTLARKAWLDEVKTLPETDELKKVLKKQYWIDIEFGIDTDANKYDHRLSPVIYKFVKKYLNYSTNTYYRQNPFDFFDDEIFHLRDHGFPLPNRNIPFDWNKDTLTVRHYFDKPPTPTGTMTWNDQITYWFGYWYELYSHEEGIGYIRDGHEWIPGNPEDYDEDSDKPVFLCIAKINIFGDKCYQVGYSLLPSSKKSQSCQQIDK